MWALEAEESVMEQQKKWSINKHGCRAALALNRSKPQSFALKRTETLRHGPGEAGGGAGAVGARGGGAQVTFTSTFITMKPRGANRLQPLFSTFPQRKKHSPHKPGTKFIFILPLCLGEFVESSQWNKHFELITVVFIMKIVSHVFPLKANTKTAPHWSLLREVFTSC